jgi:hypothetical protein
VRARAEVRSEAEGHRLCAVSVGHDVKRAWLGEGPRITVGGGRADEQDRSHREDGPVELQLFPHQPGGERHDRLKAQDFLAGLLGKGRVVPQPVPLIGVVDE